VVQSKIRSEELRASRASSVISSRVNPAVNPSTKIHPVQRFSSEGLFKTLLIQLISFFQVRATISSSPATHPITQ
jgi:hypothetical protein